MNWLIHARRTALTMALCAVFSTAGAKTFDQTGPAPASMAPLSTYGVDVATKTALKSVVPAGWQLFVHRSAVLPTAMSWRAGTTWPMALAEFVEGTDISVLVDWERKAVYFRPVAVALEDATKRIMVNQAATTPLPSLRVEGTGLKMAAPELAQNAVPPVPAVDPAAVASLEAKLHSLESQLAQAQAAKATGDQEITTRVAALEAALKEKGETLAQAKAELAAARESARQAEQVASELKTQQEASRADLETRLQALAARPLVEQAAATAVEKAVVTLPPVTEQALASAADHMTAAAGSMVATTVAAAAKAALPVANNVVVVDTAVAPLDLEQYVSLSHSKSFNRVSVRDVAQYVADVHGLHLVMEGAEAAFRGPVTVFGGDAAEDMRLMHKALGNAAGVSFELYRNERVLKVSASQSGLKSFARVAEAPYAGPLPQVVANAQPTPAAVAVAQVQRTAAAPQEAVAASAPVVHVAVPAVEATNAPVAAVVPTVPARAAPAVAATPAVAAAEPAPVAPEPVATAVVTKLRLEIGVGEDLQTAVTAFLQAQGFETRWQVEELFEASSVFVGQGNTVVEVLSLLLPKLGLSADVQSDAKRVTVRTADPVRDTK